jgi:prepilin-type processing-associated H-X9-DG protein
MPDGCGTNTVEYNYITVAGLKYASYWANQGGGIGGGIAYSNGTDGNASVPISQADIAAALGTSGIQSRHSGKLNVQWVDGHAKSLDWRQTIGNICYWTTDADGPHPNCG